MLQVYVGDRLLVQNNTFIGALMLSLTVSGIAPAAKGVARINVALDIDPDSRIRAEAENMATGENDKLAGPGIAKSGAPECSCVITAVGNRVRRL